MPGFVFCFFGDGRRRRRGREGGRSHPLLRVEKEGGSRGKMKEEELKEGGYLQKKRDGRRSVGYFQ